MMKRNGFTLVEMVVAITITGIIGAAIAVFIKSPIDTYFATARRAAIADEADGTLRRIGRDLRLALPNSVRADGSKQYLEFLPIKDAGRYRVNLTLTGSGDLLDFTSAADAAFDVLGPTVNIKNGDFFAIFNTGQCASPASCNADCSSPGANAYEGCNRRTITNTGTSATSVSFTATSQPLPFDSPTSSFFVIPNTGPVTYACENIGSSGGTGSGTLKRYSSYASGSNWATQPTSFTVTGQMLAKNLSTCSLDYNSTWSTRNGLATISLSITRDSETISLIHQIHVDNQP